MTPEHQPTGGIAREAGGGMRVPRGTTFAVIGLCAALIAAALLPTLADLNAYWLSSYTYSHGYLVAVLAGVLAFAEHRRASLAQPEASAAGVAALGLGLVLLMAARASGILAVALAVLPIVLAAAVWAATGAGNARRLSPALAYLYFAMPLWDFLIEPLQRLTTGVVTQWIRVVGVPAFIEANLIHIPSGTFEVAGGCSGLNFLIVGLALAAFFGLRYLGSWRWRALLAAAALTLAVIANWIRVFVIVLVGHATEMQNSLIVEDHYLFGWALFLLVFSPILWLGRRLEDAEGPRIEPPAPTRAVTAGELRFPALAALGAVALGGLLLSLRIDARSSRPPGMSAIALPAVPGWSRIGPWTEMSRPAFVGVTAEIGAWYRGESGTVGAYLVAYAHQEQGRELVFYANRPQGEAEQVLRRGTIAVRGADGSSVPFAELEVVDALESTRIVWISMQVAGRQTSDPVLAKVYQAIGSLVGRRDAQAVVVAARCDGTCETARSNLSEFVARAAQRLFACARRVGAPAAESHRGECDAET